jgi:hypothetical protein
VKFESANALSTDGSTAESAATGRPKVTPVEPEAGADEFDPVLVDAEPAGRQPSSATALAVFRVNARVARISHRLIIVCFLLSMIMQTTNPCGHWRRINRLDGEAKRTLRAIPSPARAYLSCSVKLEGQEKEKVLRRRIEQSPTQEKTIEPEKLTGICPPSYLEPGQSSCPKAAWSKKEIVDAQPHEPSLIPSLTCRQPAPSRQINFRKSTRAHDSASD